jgi:hypothetical protein
MELSEEHNEVKTKLLDIKFDELVKSRGLKIPQPNKFNIFFEHQLGKLFLAEFSAIFCSLTSYMYTNLNQITLHCLLLCINCRISNGSCSEDINCGCF